MRERKSSTCHRTPVLRCCSTNGSPSVEGSCSQGCSSCRMPCYCAPAAPPRNYKRAFPTARVAVRRCEHNGIAYCRIAPRPRRLHRRARQQRFVSALCQLVLLVRLPLTLIVAIRNEQSSQDRGYSSASTLVHNHCFWIFCVLAHNFCQARLTALYYYERVHGSVRNADKHTRH